MRIRKESPLNPLNLKLIVHSKISESLIPFAADEKATSNLESLVEAIQKQTGTLLTIVPKLPPLNEKYISELGKMLVIVGYNHVSDPFFIVNKKASYKQLNELAKDMIKEAIPIKCLEATVLGMYLTNPITQTSRFVISFKSQAAGNIYRHIVLCIKYREKFGAIGLSRRDDLMFKPLRFSNLSELVKEYEKCYVNNDHTLLSIGMGLPVPFDQYSPEKLIWKVC